MISKNPRDFKWRHFHGEMILQCVRWYCKYGVSYTVYDEDVARLSAYGYGHINMLGRYSFAMPDEIKVVS